MSGVAAGTLLTFVLVPGFYLTKAMVGGPRDITLSMPIADQVDRLNWGYASMFSAVLRPRHWSSWPSRRRPPVGNAVRMNLR